MYEHKRPLFAFVLVALICGIVVGTTMKSQAIFGVSVPWARATGTSPSVHAGLPSTAAPEPRKVPRAAVSTTSEKATVVVTHATQAVVRAQPVRQRTHHQRVHQSSPAQPTTNGGRHPVQPHHTPVPHSGPPKTEHTRTLHVVAALTGPEQPSAVDPEVSPAPVEPIAPEGGE